MEHIKASLSKVTNLETTTDIHGENILTDKPPKILHSMKLQSSVNQAEHAYIKFLCDLGPNLQPVQLTAASLSSIKCC